jgi:hypothetical protein
MASTAHCIQWCTTHRRTLDPDVQATLYRQASTCAVSAMFLRVSLLVLQRSRPRGSAGCPLCCDIHPPCRCTAVRPSERCLCVPLMCAPRSCAAHAVLTQCMLYTLAKVPCNESLWQQHTHRVCVVRYAPACCLRECRGLQLQAVWCLHACAATGAGSSAQGAAASSGGRLLCSRCGLPQQHW